MVVLAHTRGHNQTLNPGGEGADVDRTADPRAADTEFFSQPAQQGEGVVRPGAFLVLESFVVR